jgi:hypothetical protein
MINTEFGINYQHRFYDRFGIGLDTAIEQRPIFVAITAKGISLEQIPIVKFRAQFDLSVARGRTYDFSITGGISSLDASTYDGYTITPGRAYDAALEVSRQFKKTNLDCKLKYERRDQNSQAFSMSSRDVGVLCGLGWEQ